MTQLQVNKNPAIQPLRILAVHRGLYRGDEEYVKRVLCAIVVHGDDLPTKLVDWPEKPAFWAASCREGSFGIALWPTPSQ